MNYKISTKARNALEEILLYIKQDNPKAAMEMKDEFFAAFEHLAANPKTGRLRPEFTDKPIRFWVVRKNYWVVYSAENNEVIIQHIIHAARYIPNLV